MVTIASLHSITQTVNGSIDVRGGDGCDSWVTKAPSGGGGGGIIHLLSPSIFDAGSFVVSGGNAGGYGGNSPSNPIRCSGAGGGASGGTGGNGGAVNTNNIFTSAQNGYDGYFLKTIVDPTGLF